MKNIVTLPKLGVVHVRACDKDFSQPIATCAVVTRYKDIQGEGFAGISVWDTGATSTVISNKIVDKLRLQKIGTRTMSNSERSYTVGVYRVSIMLETGSIFSGEVVADNLPGEDVLIGRDIISRLDFHITKDDNGVPFCVIEDKSITE